MKNMQLQKTKERKYRNSTHEQTNYKVLSTQTLEKGELFVKSLLRFLESKYQQVLKLNIFYV